MQNPLNSNELEILISLAKRILWAPPKFRKKIQEHKVNIVPANFYSEIPSIAEINDSFEFRNNNEEVYNLEIFKKTLMANHASELLRYSCEFLAPQNEDECSSATQYYWNNPAFPILDATAYYCMIRHYKPKRILEIGSGMSSLVAEQAIKMNGFGNITIIDPFPSEKISKLSSVSEIFKSKIQDLGINSVLKLIEECDLWFIDSTHTVKIGSDCLFIYLQLMPRVKKELIVHTHDVFLPFPAPRDKSLEKHIYWTEQYLLYAYMLDNPKVEVLFGSYHLEKVLPDLYEKLLRDKHKASGGSLWYKLN